MNDPLRVVCPHCLATNRVPAARLGAAPACGRCHQPLFGAHPTVAGGDGFDAHLTRNDIPVLVDFWATWCGPCQMMAPHFVTAAATLEPTMRLLKVDTDAERNLAARYQIRSIPTLILFAGGREVARQSGAMQTPGIVAWARQHTP